jgi:hypothetical protein
VSWLSLLHAGIRDECDQRVLQVRLEESEKRNNNFEGTASALLENVKMLSAQLTTANTDPDNKRQRIKEIQEENKIPNKKAKTDRYLTYSCS